MTAVQPDPMDAHLRNRHLSKDGPVFTRNQAVHAARIKVRLDREADRQIEPWVIDLALTPTELLHLEAIDRLEEDRRPANASAVAHYVASHTPQAKTFPPSPPPWHGTKSTIDVLRDLGLVEVHVGMTWPLRWGSEARTPKNIGLSLTRAGYEALERAHRAVTDDTAREEPVAASDLRAGDRYDGSTVVVRVDPAEPRRDQRAKNRNTLVDRVTVKGTRVANGHSSEDTRDFDANQIVHTVRRSDPSENV